MFDNARLQNIFSNIHIHYKLIKRYTNHIANINNNKTKITEIYVRVIIIHQSLLDIGRITNNFCSQIEGSFISPNKYLNILRTKLLHWYHVERWIFEFPRENVLNCYNSLTESRNSFKNVDPTYRKIHKRKKNCRNPSPIFTPCRAANPNHSQLSSYIALCLIVTPTHEEMNQIYKAYWTHQPNWKLKQNHIHIIRRSGRLKKKGKYWRDKNIYDWTCHKLKLKHQMYLWSENYGWKQMQILPKVITSI